MNLNFLTAENLKARHEAHEAMEELEKGEAISFEEWKKAVTKKRRRGIFVRCTR